MGQAAELEAGLAEREQALIETNRVGWRDSLTSLDEQATRVVAAQIAGLIAI
jgi:hypothetical protein